MTQEANGRQPARIDRAVDARTAKMSAPLSHGEWSGLSCYVRLSDDDRSKLCLERRGWGELDASGQRERGCGRGTWDEQ